MHGGERRLRERAKESEGKRRLRGAEVWWVKAKGGEGGKVGEGRVQ